jgi:hypothetical protein
MRCSGFGVLLLLRLLRGYQAPKFPDHEVFAAKRVQCGIEPTCVLDDGNSLPAMGLCRPSPQDGGLLYPPRHSDVALARRTQVWRSL